MVLPTSRGGVPGGGRALPGTFLEPHVTIEGSVMPSPAKPLKLELKTSLCPYPKAAAMHRKVVHLL